MALLLEKGISLERLQSLVDISEHGGVSKAAPGNVMRQNLIGRQLRELEAFFHAKLSERRGKIVVLNERGKTLAQLASETLRSLEDFKKQSHGTRRIFTLGAGGTLFDELLAPRAVELRKQSLELHLLERMHDALIEELRDGTIDAGLLWADLPKSAGFAHIVVGKIEYALFGSRRLIAKRRSLSALMELPTVVVLHRDLTEEVKRHLCAEEVIYVDEQLPALRLVETGEYVAVLPRLYGDRLPSSSFIGVPLKLFDPYARTVRFVWNPRHMERRSFSKRWIEEMAQHFRIRT